MIAMIFFLVGIAVGVIAGYAIARSIFYKPPEQTTKCPPKAIIVVKGPVTNR